MQSEQRNEEWVSLGRAQALPSAPETPSGPRNGGDGPASNGGASPVSHERAAETDSESNVPRSGRSDSREQKTVLV